MRRRGLIFPGIHFETPAYANTGGTGDRRSIITVTETAGLLNGDNAGGTTKGPLLVNGASVDGENFFNDALGPSKVIKFAWVGGVQVRITEFTWAQGNTHSVGTWVFEGSNDGSNFTQLGTSFTLGLANVNDVHSFTNENGYSTYQLRLTGSVTSSNPWLREITFKIGNRTT